MSLRWGWMGARRGRNDDDLLKEEVFEGKERGRACANENGRSDGGPRWMLLVHCLLLLCIDRWQRRRSRLLRFRFRLSSSPSSASVPPRSSTHCSSALAGKQRFLIVRTPLHNMPRKDDRQTGRRDTSESSQGIENPRPPPSPRPSNPPVTPQIQFAK